MAQCAHRSARRGHRSLTLSSGVLGGSARYRSPSFCLASRAIGLMTSWRLCCVGCARHEGFSFDRSASGVMNMPIFARYVGIDYSGAQTPTASLKGLRVYMSEGDAKPAEVLPPPSPRKYWSRRGVAEWLVELSATNVPALVGIDHGFSFPLRYFEAHGLEPDWSAFLDDFQRHWPTDEDIYVDFVRDGAHGDGAARTGRAHWRRLTEERATGAKSVFHFDVQGSVAKATHAGIPWLRFIRQRVGDRVHFWPFDGWQIPAGRSVIAEVYPALWNRSFAREDRAPDQHDAYSVAAWLSRADRTGSLGALLLPDLSPAERATAQVEGWILGVYGFVRDDKRTNGTGTVNS